MTPRQQHEINTDDFSVDNYLSGKFKIDEFVIYKSYSDTDKINFWVALPYVASSDGDLDWNEDKLTFPSKDMIIKFCNVMNVTYSEDW